MMAAFERKTGKTVALIFGSYELPTGCADPQGMKPVAA